MTAEKTTMAKTDKWRAPHALTLLSSLTIAAVAHMKETPLLTIDVGCCKYNFCNFHFAKFSPS